MLFGPFGKGQKKAEKGRKGRFRPISSKGGHTPLKPPFATPPFAAAQILLVIFQFRLKTSISLENFNLDLQDFPLRKGLGGRLARIFILSLDLVVFRDPKGLNLEQKPSRLKIFRK